MQHYNIINIGKNRYQWCELRWSRCKSRICCYIGIFGIVSHTCSNTQYCTPDCSWLGEILALGNQPHFILTCGDNTIQWCLFMLLMLCANHANIYFVPRFIIILVVDFSVMNCVTICYVVAFFCISYCLKLNGGFL